MDIVFSGWAAILKGRSRHRDVNPGTDDQRPDDLPEPRPLDRPVTPTSVPARWPSSEHPGRPGN